MRFGMALWPVCLSGCADPSAKAGLGGPNPVIEIVVSEASLEPASNVTYSIDQHGTVEFTDKMNGTSHRWKLRTGQFRQTALELAPFRQRGGSKRKLAEDCRSWMTDIGGLTLSWVYADGSIGRVWKTGCYDEESHKFGVSVVRLQSRLGVKGMLLKALR